jgi:hypothetical protein
VRNRWVAIVAGVVVVGTLMLACSGDAPSSTTPPTGSTSGSPGGPVAFQGVSQDEVPDGTEIAISPPPEARAGDILIAVILAPGTQAEKDGRRIVGPQGWNYIQGALHATWWWRAFDPSDSSASWTWTAEEVGRRFNWNAFIYSYGDVDQSNPIVSSSVTRACSDSNDPVCDRAAGTPGQLIAPPLQVETGSIVLTWYTSHSRGENQLTLPSGFSSRSTSVIEKGGAVTVAGDAVFDEAGSAGPFAATTSNPDFVHGIAGAVALRPAG